MDAYTKVKDPGQEKVEDKISNLPDEVLICILSFLHTKEAVSTSTLSKRWNSLWTFLPTLSASIYKPGLGEIENRFLDFVDKVLIGHKMPFLEKINISSTYLDNTRITSWISAAAKQDVCTLKLSSKYCEEPLCSLPSCLFTMNKIVKLFLDFSLRLSFPFVSDCFPNLKKLVLCRLMYEDDKSIQNLISSCPVLEKFYLNRFGFDGLKDVNVSSRSLKTLSFGVYELVEEEELDYVPKLTIDCPAVEYVRIEDIVTEEFIIRDLSSVVKARLNLANYRHPFYEGTYARRVFELLSTFSNVKTLSVSESTLSTMSAADGEILPTFHNLKQLRFFGLDDLEWNMKAIIEFLKSTPVLEVLKFKGFTFSDEEFDSSHADVPNCLISHLKTIKITGYLGRRDKEKVRYFLENSKVLENWIFKHKSAEFMGYITPGSSACRLSV
jgi:hypothetical protein